MWEKILFSDSKMWWNDRKVSHGFGWFNIVEPDYKANHSHGPKQILVRKLPNKGKLWCGMTFKTWDQNIHVCGSLYSLRLQKVGWEEISLKVQLKIAPKKLILVWYGVSLMGGRIALPELSDISSWLLHIPRDLAYESFPPVTFISLIA